MKNPPKGQLNERQALFCKEYITDLNATQAYRRAGYKGGDAVCAQGASKLLRNAKVCEEIQRLMDERSKELAINSKDALQYIWDRATADPRELVETKVGSCRWCHGDGHQYQRTMVEMAKAKEDWRKKGNELAEFDEQGGIGYNPNKSPHPDCPQCFGDGEARVVIKDTRNISRAAASLFAGAKQGKNGIEVMLHDQGKHIEMVGRHLKLFTDVLEVKDGDAMAERLARARERRAAK